MVYQVLRPFPSTIHVSRLSPCPTRKYGQLNNNKYSMVAVRSVVFFFAGRVCARATLRVHVVLSFSIGPRLQARGPVADYQGKTYWGTKMCDKKYNEKMHATTPSPPPPPPKRRGKLKAGIMYHTTSKRILYAVQR